MHWKKYSFLICLIILFFSSIFSCHSMEQDEERGVSIVRDPENQTRRRINTSLEGVLYAKENTPLLQDNQPNFETALVIYRNPLEEVEESDRPPTWDNAPLFLDDLDKRFFNQHRSKKTWAAMVLGWVDGGVAPFGMAPLVMYLGENLLNFIPVASPQSYSILLFVGLTTIPPCMRQMHERMDIIGNKLFDKKGFTPSRSDKKPHIQNLDITFKCCRIPSSPLFIVFAAINGAFRALPPTLLFWEAEEYFGTYRYTCIGPLAAFYFEKGYREGMEFCTRLANKQESNPLHMVVEKKEILSNRLKRLHQLINANASNDLVHALYTEIQAALNKPENGQDVSASAFSLLLLKKTSQKTFSGLQEDLGELSQKIQSPSTALMEVIRDVKGIPIESMKNLISDIDNIRPKTTAASFLEKLANHVQGAASPGRFLITLWAVQTISTYLGINTDASFYTGIGVAGLDIIFRAASEWYLQEDTLSNLRRVGSRNMDAWPFRWVTNALSAAVSTFFTLPPVAILFRVLGDNCPTYVKVILSAATAPSEFTSFFAFFKEKYAHLITGAMTTHVKTIPQERAWLNEHIEKALLLVRDLDQTSTEQVYHWTQEGL